MARQSLHKLQSGASAVRQPVMSQLEYKSYNSSMLPVSTCRDPTYLEGTGQDAHVAAVAVAQHPLSQRGSGLCRRLPDSLRSLAGWCRWVL